MVEKLDYEVRDIDATTLTWAYQDFGAIIAVPVVGIVIFNTSNMPIYVWSNLSYDDIFVPGYSKVEIFPYEKHNDRLESSYVCNAGTQLRVKVVTNIAKGGDIIANIFT